MKERIILTPHAVKRHSKRLHNNLVNLYNDIKNNNVNIEDINLTFAQNFFAQALGLQGWHEMHKILKEENSIINNSQETGIKNSLVTFDMPLVMSLAKSLNFNGLLVELFKDLEIENLYLKINDYMRYSKNKYLEKLDVKISKEFILAIFDVLNISHNALERVQYGMPIDLLHKIQVNRNETLHFFINISGFTDSNDKGCEVTIRRKYNGNLIDLKNVFPFNSIESFLKHDSGIVLINGKLDVKPSALIHSVIKNRIDNEHIKVLTYESPLEYIYDANDNHSSISQTEVGISTESFLTGVRNAMRRKPDVIYVSELSDQETIKQLIQASEYNHAIYSSLNTESIEQSFVKLYQTFVNKQELYDFFSQLQCMVNIKKIQDDNRHILLLEYLVFNEEILEDILKSLDNNCNISDFKLLSRQLLNKYGTSFKTNAEKAMNDNVISKSAYLQYFK